MSKLLPRLEGGGGGGCPVVVFGIRRAAFEDDLGSPAPLIPVDPALLTSGEED